MSIERELLKKVISGDNKGDFFISYDLYKEIYEFLVHPEQTEQEPVATKLESHQFTAFHVSADDFKKLRELPTGTKIYTAPPKREPLSDEEIYSIGNKYAFHAAVREIERMHGIGGGK